MTSYASELDYLKAQISSCRSAIKILKSELSEMDKRMPEDSDGTKARVLNTLQDGIASIEQEQAELTLSIERERGRDEDREAPDFPKEQFLKIQDLE